MKNSVEVSQNISNEIISDILPKFNFEGDTYQFKVNIMPIISNTIYKREKELLEKERFETLITLARVLDNPTIETVIKALKYSLIVK